jgi:glycosyltransferase involved in cell wall biosynthesis
VPPKPTIWQGQHRVTKVNWWATSNARNTGIVLADHDYIVFCDDRSRLGPRWIDAVRVGSRERASVLFDSTGDTVTNLVEEGSHRSPIIRSVSASHRQFTDEQRIHSSTGTTPS